MSSIIKPIKRSPQLAPLSREHHEGLLFVWKIRQGLRNDTAPTFISSFILWFWKEILEAHLVKEETVFAGHLVDTDPMFLRMVGEHALIRKHIQQIAVLQETGNVETLPLQALSDLLEKHIRFEERELFPHIEQQLYPAALEAVATQVSAPPAVCTPWENEFWLNKKR